MAKMHQHKPQNIYITTTTFATNNDRVLKTGATNVFRQQEVNCVTSAAPVQWRSYSAITLYRPANVIAPNGLRYTAKLKKNVT